MLQLVSPLAACSCSPLASCSCMQLFPPSCSMQLFYHCTILSSLVLAVDVCTPLTYPPFVFSPRTGPTSRYAANVQFLVNQHPFGCNGRVSRWEVYTVGSNTHPIEFTVWRFNSFTTLSVFGILVNGSIYDLVGSNYFADAAPGENNLLSLEVPPEEQIEIREGDIPGIRSMNDGGTTSVSPFKVQIDPQGGVLFYTLPVTEETPQSLQVATVQPYLGVPILRVTVNGKTSLVKEWFMNVCLLPMITFF